MRRKKNFVLVAQVRSYTTTLEQTQVSARFLIAAFVQKSWNLRVRVDLHESFVELCACADVDSVRVVTVSECVSE